MRAVIFDFDGTLADSFTAVIAITYELTKREQLKDIDYVMRMRRNNVGLRQAIKILKIPRWQWTWLLRRGRWVMTKDIHKIPLFSGMRDVVARLYGEKYELYIISSNSKHNIERFLSEKGLLMYFRGVYGGAGLFDKQRLIKRVLKDNRLPRDSVVYVGDEVRDIVAAKQLNLPVIAVAWGYNNEQLLLSYQPTVIVRRPQQLAKVIVGWDKTL